MLEAGLKKGWDYSFLKQRPDVELQLQEMWFVSGKLSIPYSHAHVQSSLWFVSYQEMPDQECEAVVQRDRELAWKLAWKSLSPKSDYCCHLYFRMAGGEGDL